MTYEISKSRFGEPGLPANRPCTQAGAICTSDDRRLTNQLEGTVQGPDIPTVSIATGSGSVIEGAAATFTVSRTGGSSSALSVSVSISEAGSFLAGAPPSSVQIPSGSSQATLAVPTDDDSVVESDGSVTATLQADSGYVIRSEAASATVPVRDNDGGLAPPPPSGIGQAPQSLHPLQLGLWTDKPAYRPGEGVRLFHTLLPATDRRDYTVVYYLEQPGSGERRYLAPLSSSRALREEPVDQYGRPEGAVRAGVLVPAERALAWQGHAPEPGLWHFVMDVRPAEPDGEPERQDVEPLEPPRRRQAWAKFVVAERSQLLIRAGLDREVSKDLALRSDTVYYLLSQVFVRDGTTLSIQPGTVVLSRGRNAAIIVERGGRIVAEGTREAPVVLTCALPPGQRAPGCWGGLRILGKAPVTRLEGVAEGALPADRPVYGGTDPDDSSGVLRHVRVEFAGAGPEPGTSTAAIGFHGVGSGTTVEYIQAHASLNDGIAFSGGTAACNYCVASGSGKAGLAWERGWRGAASHLYVQHGSGGLDGIRGDNDPRGHDLEPRSLPDLSNVTLVHSSPYDQRGREGAGLRLGTGTGVRARNLLATRFGGGAITATARAALLFTQGESSVSNALLYRNFYRPGGFQVGGAIVSGVEFQALDPILRNTGYEPNPDPRPREASPALANSAPPAADGGTTAGEAYTGAFGKQNWLEEWTVFGPESDYDTRDAEGGEGQR